jgi:hypothetical protein
VKTRSIKEIAEEIFRRESRPLHYKELTQMIMRERTLQGQTPHETVRSSIGTDPRFKRVAEGVYALTEWTEYPEVRFAKDIAYDVLKSQGRPMTMIDLGEAVLEERDFFGGPKQVARNVLRSDERFYYDPESQLVGLVEWGALNQATKSQE